MKMVLIHFRKVALFLGQHWSCSWATAGPLPRPRSTAALTRVPDPGQDLVQPHLNWTPVMSAAAARQSLGVLFQSL